MIRNLVLVALLALTTPAWAIFNGQPDNVNNNKAYSDADADADARAAAIGVNKSSNRNSAKADGGTGVGVGVGIGDGGDARNSNKISTGASSGAYNGGNKLKVVDGDQLNNQKVVDGDQITRLNLTDESETLTRQQLIDGDTKQVVHGDDFEQKIVDGDTSFTDNGSVKTETATEQGQETNIIDESDNSYTDNSVYEYRISAHASAGVAISMMQGCYGIGGTDARGSGSQRAGGLTLNIFKLTNDRCVLAAKALEQQAAGNLNAYATMTCADKAVWRGYRTVMKATQKQRISQDEAIVACMDDIETTAKNLTIQLTKIENEVKQLIAQMQEDGYDDSEIRARVRTLEEVAHLPNSGFLLKHD